MEKNNLTPEESFSIITNAITSLKTNYKDNAKSFLLWGWMLTFASISNFIIIVILKQQEAWQLMGPLSLANWFVFCLVTFIILFFMDRKINKTKKVYSLLEDYIKKLWIVYAVTMFTAIFLCIKLQLVPPPILLLITGLATTVTGLLIKFRPLIFGGIAFFVFSIAATFVTNEYLSLIVGASIICGYLIPGYLLKSAKE